MKGNVGQTRQEREFLLPGPVVPKGGSFSMMTPAASSSEAQFQDYESVVEAARAAIESANQQL